MQHLLLPEINLEIGLISTIYIANCPNLKAKEYVTQALGEGATAYALNASLPVSFSATIFCIISFMCYSVGCADIY